MLILVEVSCYILFAFTANDSGALDLVECMASSDNVVRVALTKKVRNPDLMMRMLTYNFPPLVTLRQHPVRELVVELPPNRSEGNSNRSTCLVYDPPTPEIKLISVLLGVKGARVWIHGGEFMNAIVSCVQGSGLLCLSLKECSKEDRKDLRTQFGHVLFIEKEDTAVGLWLESTGQEQFWVVLACDSSSPKPDQS